MLTGLDGLLAICAWFVKRQPFFKGRSKLPSSVWEKRIDDRVVSPVEIAVFLVERMRQM
jgi:hypothetical protein